MGDWIPAIGVIGLAAVIGTTFVLTGPLGKALADWIRTWSRTDQQWLAVQAAKHGVPAAPELVGEVEELKRRLTELEERLDFTERLLAQERSPDRLARPR
jgi:hypothetical protein